MYIQAYVTSTIFGTFSFGRRGALFLLLKLAQGNAPQVVGARHGHDGIDGEEVVVDGDDLCRIARPDNSSDEDGCMGIGGRGMGG